MTCKRCHTETPILYQDFNRKEHLRFCKTCFDEYELYLNIDSRCHACTSSKEEEDD